MYFFNQKRKEKGILNEIERFAIYFEPRGRNLLNGNSLHYPHAVFPSKITENLKLSPNPNSIKEEYSHHQ